MRCSVRTNEKLSSPQYDCQTVSFPPFAALALCWHFKLALRYSGVFLQRSVSSPFPFHPRQAESWQPAACSAQSCCRGSAWSETVCQDSGLTTKPPLGNSRDDTKRDLSERIGGLTRQKRQSWCEGTRRNNQQDNNCCTEKVQ